MWGCLFSQIPTNTLWLTGFKMVSCGAIQGNTRKRCPSSESLFFRLLLLSVDSVVVIAEPLYIRAVTYLVSVLFCRNSEGSVKTTIISCGFKFYSTYMCLLISSFGLVLILSLLYVFCEKTNLKLYDEKHDSKIWFLNDGNQTFWYF